MVTEAINTEIAAGACPKCTLVRADSAYCAGKVVAAVVKAGAAFSFTIARNRSVDAAIASIPDEAYTPVRYPGAVVDPDTGALISDAQVAEVPYTAASEIGRLQRLRSSGHAVGSIGLASTLTVLARAAGSQHTPDRATTSHIYKRLRQLDDGLPPIEATDLLASQLWS